MVCCLLGMDDVINIEPDLLPEQLATQPPQDPEVRRNIRMQYRTLLNDVSSEYMKNSHSSLAFLL